jgi:hypothetical protein
MTAFDDFFRANYLRMVRYVANYHPRFVRQDAEEVVSDVIHRYYDEYRQKLEAEVSAETTMRRWMIRRAALNMLSRYELWHHVAFDRLPEDHDELSFDDPADIVDLKQRLPEVPVVLIEYEIYTDQPVERALTHRYSRARKKFMDQLKGEST